MRYVRAAVIAAAMLLATPAQEAGAWERLGGSDLVGNISCTARLNIIHCFVRSSDNAILYRSNSGSGWSDWERAYGVFTGSPECLMVRSSSSRPHSMCFARGADRAMWYAQGWTWTSLGGAITSNISCTSWASDRVDCFARGTDNAMYHRWKSGSSWGGWETLGGNITSHPECVSWGENRIDCFARGTDNLIWHRWWPAGSTWGEWERPGSAHITTRGNISCTAWSVGGSRIDCFTRSRAGAMLHLAWNSRSWGRWENLGGGPGGVISSDPNCVSRTINRIDCFARGTDGAMWHRAWDGRRWIAWQSLGGAIVSRPECVSWHESRISCFALGTDRTLLHRWWDGSAWRP